MATRAVACLLASTAVLLAACNPAAPARPPEDCRPAAVLPDGAWFTDASDELGLRDLGVDGNRLSAADFTGDGWPDLAVMASSNGLRDDFDDPEARRLRWLLANDQGQGLSDVTRDSGFTATRDGADGRSANFVLWGDVDNDGDLDAVSVAHNWEVDADHPDTGDRSEVLLNDGSGSFSLAESSDFSDPSEFAPRTAASLLDADRDGRLDVFVGNQYGTFGYPNTAQQDQLFLGTADGRMRDRTEGSGLGVEFGGPVSANSSPDYTEAEGGEVRWATFGTVACDVDDDGDADLLSLSYGRGLNQFWENQGDGTYTNRTAGSGFSSDGGDGRDYSTDERFRCWCQSNPTSADCSGVPDPRIGCSPGGWTPGWDTEMHRLGGNTFSAVCDDLDGDGDMDVATGEIRHWWTPGASDPSTILWNNGDRPTTFTRRPLEDTGLALDHGSMVDWNEGDLTVSAFDFDHDGVIDILRPQSDYPATRLRLFRGLGDGAFEEVAERAGIDFPRAAGLALLDFDRDGDLDVFTSFSRMRCDADCPYATPEVHYFRNDAGQLRNALQIELRGTGLTNAAAIGAKVTIEAGGRTQVRELRAGYGHQGVQDELLIDFGLGDTCAVDRVTVRWPDAAGTTEVWENLPANWRVQLTQGAEQPLWADWGFDGEG